MNALNPPTTEFASAGASHRSNEADLSQILLTVWRHKLLVLGVTSVITVLSYLYISSLTPEYTAEATLLLDTRNANVGIDPVVQDLRPDATVIRSEVDVLRSRWLAHRVVEHLDLAHDPEFNPQLRPPEASLLERLGAFPWLPEPLRRRLADPQHDAAAEAALQGSGPQPQSAGSSLLERLGILDWLPGRLRGLLADARDEAAVDRLVSPQEQGHDPIADLVDQVRQIEMAAATEPSEDTSATGLSTVINILLSKLTVLNDGRSYTVTLYYESEDPLKAARIANAFADLYLAGQRESKYHAAERGAAWLEKKIGELRERLRRAENAVLEYRNDHSLLDVGGGTVLDSRLAVLTDELDNSKNQRVRAEIRLSEFRRLVAAIERGSFTPGMGEPREFERLLAATRDAKARLTEAGTSFGENHPQIIQLKAEVQELETQVEQEIHRIVAGLQSEASLAAAQEKEFAAELQRLESENLRAHRDALELHSLASGAAASRSLLDTFLASLDRTAVQLDLVQPDARVLSRAEGPTWPSYPQRRILLALAVIASLMVSLGIVFVLEFLHKGFRAAQPIEGAFGVPVLGMVPRVKTRVHPSRYALERPFSTFTESIRLIRSATQLSDVDALPKVVLITSAIPDEGKTALALTLGRLGAASGQRVLLIDCDLRAPSVATDLGATCRKGLTELLTGEATLDEAVGIDKMSGLRFIPAGRGSFDAIELLSSGRMKSIIEAAYRVSDTVILDSPPVGVVSDPLALSQVADMTLMVVRWDRTPRSLVAEAMKKLVAAKALPTGIVLSQVDLARHASYGFGDFPHGYLKGYLSG